MITPSEKKLDDALAQVVSTFDLLSYLQPVNLDREKKRFFEERGSNPIFRYAPLQKDKIEKSLKRLESCDSAEGEFSELLEKRKEELTQSLLLSQKIGTPKFFPDSLELFPLPSEEATLRARNILRKYQSFSKKKKKAKFLLAHEAKDVALQYLEKLGIDGIKVVIQGGRSVRVSVEKGSSTIYIAAGSKFGPQSLQGVLAHEVGVHVVRGVNAKSQPLQLFEIGTDHYLGCEEGLATIARKMVTSNPYFVSTSYFVIAADAGSRSSFRETYNLLRKLGATEENAWKYTFRVKRGLGDTSKPGVFAKDAQYLLGVFELEKYFSQGGKIYDLFIGKVSPRDVEVLAGNESIKPPKVIPDFFVDAESAVLELLARNS